MLAESCRDDYEAEREALRVETNLDESLRVRVAARLFLEACSACDATLQYEESAVTSDDIPRRSV